MQEYFSDIKNVVRLTLREIWVNKTAIIIFSIYNFLLIVFSAITIYIYKTDPSVALNSEKFTVFKFLLLLITPSATLFNLVAVFTTANLSVSFMPKGLIDLYLSKPLERKTLFIGRFLGILLFLFLNFLYMTIFITVVALFLFGKVDLLIFIYPFLLTLGFSLLLVTMFLFAVLTRSAVMPIVASFLILFIEPIFSSLHDNVPLMMNVKPLFKYIIEFFYYILPKVNFFFANIIGSLAESRSINWQEPIIISVLYFTVIFSTSIYLFDKKDF